MRKVIPVKKVAFSGRTGDDRTPESFPFPACMASLLDAMEGEQPTVPVKAHGREYSKRPANDAVLAASGMAFGFLWETSRCFSALDLMQVTPHAETLRRGFDELGYDVDILEGDALANARERVVASIDAGAPVLAFGVIDPPECALICGYDEDGAVLLGTSHFQDECGLAADPETGFFRAPDWQAGTWMMAIPGAKRGRTIPVRDVLAHGLSVLRALEIDGYLAGQAAHEAWRRDLTAMASADEGERAACYRYHNAILFSLAELRCWGANYLRGQGVPEAAQCFSDIHDLCWQAHHALPNAEALADAGAREQAIQILSQIADKDKQAERALHLWLDRNI